MNMGRHCMAVAAHLWLVDDEGRILFARRANTGYADGQWSVPAGHVEQGETLAAACAREVLEEVGVVVDASRLAFKLVQHKRDFDGDERIDMFFAVRLPPGQTPRICEPTRCDGLMWALPTDPPGPLVGYVANALRHYTEGLMGVAYFGFASD